MHFLRSPLAAKPKHLHVQKQFQQLCRLSNQRFHLLIFDYFQNLSQMEGNSLLKSVQWKKGKYIKIYCNATNSG